MTVPTNKTRARQAQEIFERSLDFSGTRRELFLHRACGADDMLRGEVDALLQADTAAGEFLADPAVRHDTRPIPFDSVVELDFPQRRVGEYHIDGLLGQGGTSRVYVARLDRAGSHRRVAIKVVREEVCSQDLRTRFQREQDALAALDHPGIARLLGSGKSSRGLPYFVMELVDGSELGSYCDDHRSTIDERLELFLQICSAVQHAHRNLVVHRDLKPGNILVANDGRAKLLDFGLAAFLDPLAGEQTRTRATRLTPAYASPEQLGGGRITTATDVFALGVVLYELLCGSRPFDWTGMTLPEILRQLEQAPQPPSLPSHLDREAGAAEAIARSRSMAPEALRRRLRGDLDAIVRRATRIDPDLRYGSVRQLAADIEREREGFPITARPARPGYRLRKLVGRHRWLAAQAAVVLVMLLASGVVAVRQSRLAATERDIAERQRSLAAREGKRAQEAIRFLVDSFAAWDPYDGHGTDITAAEVLARAAHRVESDLGSQPQLQIDLMLTLGRVYSRLGLSDEAQAVLEAALERQQALSGDRHPDTALVLIEQSRLAGARGLFEQADSLARRVLEIQRQAAPPRTTALATSLRWHAEVLAELGRLREAEDTIREAMVSSPAQEANERHLANDHKVLTEVLYLQGRYDEALQSAERVLTLYRRTLPAHHLEIAEALNNVAAVQWMLGRNGEAEIAFRQALAIRRQGLPADHPLLATSLNNLANLRLSVGDQLEAITLLEEALSINRHRLGETHPTTVLTRSNLANAVSAAGRYGDAERLYREVVEQQRAARGETHRETLNALGNLGDLLLLMERYSEAEAVLRGVEELRSRRTEPNRYMATKASLARVLHQRGDLEGAVRLYREGRQEAVAALGPGHWQTATIDVHLAETLLLAGQAQEALELVQRGLATLVSALPRDHWRMRVAQSVLGSVLLSAGRETEGRALLDEAYGALRELKGENAAQTREAAARLRRAKEHAVAAGVTRRPAEETS